MSFEAASSVGGRSDLQRAYTSASRATSTSPLCRKRNDAVYGAPERYIVTTSVVKYRQLQSSLPHRLQGQFREDYPRPPGLPPDPNTPSAPALAAPAVSLSPNPLLPPPPMAHPDVATLSCSVMARPLVAVLVYACIIFASARAFASACVRGPCLPDCRPTHTVLTTSLAT